MFSAHVANVSLLEKQPIIPCDSDENKKALITIHLAFTCWFMKTIFYAWGRLLEETSTYACTHTADDAWRSTAWRQALLQAAKEGLDLQPANRIKIALNLTRNVVCCELPFYSRCVSWLRKTHAGTQKCLTQVTLFFIIWCKSCLFTMLYSRGLTISNCVFISNKCLIILQLHQFHFCKLCKFSGYFTFLHSDSCHVRRSLAQPE